MVIKTFRTGLAIAYEPRKPGGKTSVEGWTGRPQGSLYSQQKRKISNAVEYMRTTGIYRPLIFCLTSPGFMDNADQPRFLKKFLDNTRKNYGMNNYLWVREYTGPGFPHFHFVADMPPIENPKKLSVYWSSLFGADAVNSIRLGTAPKPGKPRRFFIDNPRMSWYLTKYIGKGIGDEEKPRKRKIRAFGMSNDLQIHSEPDEWEEIILERKNEFGGIVGHSRQFVCISDHNGNEGLILTEKDLSKWDWKKCQNHEVYFGLNSRKQKKN